MYKESKVKKEARTFDAQIVDRVKHGHIPDLRLAKRCDYFYNNSWRDPEYVKLDYVDQFNLIESSIRKYSKKRTARVLEVGCGPGYLSLELARSGHKVTGIDISGACIDLAKLTAERDPYKKKRGALEYHCVDFLDEDKLIGKDKYDCIVFLGTLHHFKNQDQVMKRTRDCLKKDGHIYIHEPVRDRVCERNAIFVYMLKVLLSLNRGFYQEIALPDEDSDLDNNIHSIYAGLKYEDLDGNKIQSVNDNEAGYRDMCKAFDEHFKGVYEEDRYAFFHEIIGGLRFGDKINYALARFLREIDKRLVKTGSLQATEFFKIGKKK